jgi:hypothetical protein
VTNTAALTSALQRVVKAYIAAGLLFMLLPGTFLGVWNLISISDQHSKSGLSPAWIQAHGHAQIFGWIGSFVIGIGFFSLSKMGEMKAWLIRRGCISWSLWVPGVTLHWLTGVYGWQWRILQPLSCVAELAGFLLFFLAVRQHKPKQTKSDLPVLSNAPQGWMKLVIASTGGFLFALLWNLAISLCVAVQNIGPQYPKRADQHLLTISVWGFLVLTVWGFNARWLPMFAGVAQPRERGLLCALALAAAGVLSALLNAPLVAGLLVVSASAVAAWSLRVYSKPAREKVFPLAFVRVAYAWLVTGALLLTWAAVADKNGGILGAGRHALTVGFIGTMVFVFGPHLLPSFCGGRALFSKQLVTAALLLLNAGCVLRVFSEIPAYEGYFAPAWKVLPLSAVVELTAVSLFALNVFVSIAKAPAAQILRNAKAGGTSWASN